MIPILQKDNSYSAAHLVDGFIVLINKSEKWSSFDVVRKVRNITRIKKVGHSGTLDPFATGLMILGAGRGTKMMTELIGRSKSYRACIQIGTETDTYDCTGQIVHTRQHLDLTVEQVSETVLELTGKLDQVPPMFSAKKKDGKPLYKLARKGISVERKPVPVEIFESKILSWNQPYLTLDLKVSKGTYIRSYAHDLGERLGTGAHLKTLHRMTIDPYNVEESYTIEEFQSWWNTVVV